MHTMFNCMHTLCCLFCAVSFVLPMTENDPTGSDPTGSDPTGSGTSGQASKIILTIVALLSVWVGYILP